VLVYVYLSLPPSLSPSLPPYLARLGGHDQASFPLFCLQLPEQQRLSVLSLSAAVCQFHDLGREGGRVGGREGG